MSKYTLRETAKKDLKEIGRYTKKNWGVEQRNKYLQQFSKRFLWLAENPLFGRARNEVKHGYFSYTRGVWDLGVNVRPIYFMARRNDE